jgi:hypothetical protein
MFQSRQYQKKLATNRKFKTAFAESSVSEARQGHRKAPRDPAPCKLATESEFSIFFIISQYRLTSGDTDFLLVASFRGSWICQLTGTLLIASPRGNPAPKRTYNSSYIY